jgi:hypothetical protein
MINGAKVSYEERDIQYSFGAGALHAKTSLSLPLSDLVRALHESDDFGVPNAEHGTAAGVFHDAKVALDLPHLKEFPSIHSQGARVVVVSQVYLYQV